MYIGTSHVARFPPFAKTLQEKKACLIYICKERQNNYNLLIENENFNKVAILTLKKIIILPLKINTQYNLIK